MIEEQSHERLLSIHAYCHSHLEKEASMEAEELGRSARPDMPSDFRHMHEDDLHEHVIHTAAKKGRLNNVILLLKEHASIDALNEWGQTALHIAPKGDKAAFVGVLLKTDAKRDMLDNVSRTPAHLAASGSGLRSLRILLQYKLDLSMGAFINGCWTPLHMAADNLETTEFLITHGADRNHSKANGYAALRLAIAWVQYLVVETLLQHGGDAAKTTEDGLTDFGLAIQSSE
ncbi:unnamed protein product [Fusarium fujikuroi]|nr:unnamed protein product [Fusarium fujikuroi]VTT83855.1 unnamed protein product [Fusarium fujikuroi]VZI13467.1 unnamed protein product [Fusarium fujikuroi]